MDARQMFAVALALGSVLRGTALLLMTLFAVVLLYRREAVNRFNPVRLKVVAAMAVGSIPLLTLVCITRVPAKLLILMGCEWLWVGGMLFVIIPWMIHQRHP